MPEASRPLQTAAKLPTPSRANRVGGTRPEEMVAGRLRQSVEREAGAAAAAELPPPPRLVPSWLRDPGTSGPEPTRLMISDGDLRATGDHTPYALERLRPVCANAASAASRWARSAPSLPRAFSRARASRFDLAWR